MLINPFTPSEIASSPEDFFGRRDELAIIERSLHQGSVAIEGPMGIGKSSLLARASLMMEGFDSDHKCTVSISVCDPDIKTIDDAARLLLESFVVVDEAKNLIKFKLAGLLEIESSEIVKNYVAGRHLAVMKRLIEKQNMKRVLKGGESLILAFDEADKCPAPLAGLIRSLSTHAQQHGVQRLRFLLAGVTPFLQRIADADPGVTRFIYQTIPLESMSQDDALELLETKLSRVIEDAQRRGVFLRLENRVVSRLLTLSGGHPHILQLLGSHLVEHEDQNPDGILDSNDLYDSLARICYSDRKLVYDRLLHFLEVNQQLDHLKELLSLSEPGLPTRIVRATARQACEETDLQWLVDNRILTTPGGEIYGLADEFLRIRLLLDAAKTPEEQRNLEAYVFRQRLSDYRPL
ncbi:MAG TPA: hypothetical protein VGS57_01565 [Thermoanaerobaculia bacterium]|jgi:hypothetical protein|nr:hypothetical protein [Thermoanaerobaculia bacterium]